MSLTKRRRLGYRRRLSYIGLIGILLLLLAACGSDEAATSTPESMESETIEAPVEEATVEETMEEEGISTTEMMTSTDTMTSTDEMTSTEMMTSTDEMTSTDMVTSTDEMTSVSASAISTTAETTSTQDITQTGDITEGSAVTESTAMTESANAGSTDTVQGPLLLAYTLINQPFQTANGEESGSIEDFVVDLRTGAVLFAQIEYGGFLDIGDTELLIPLQTLQWRSVEQDIVLDFDAQMLENYPDLTTGSPRLGDPEWYSGVVNFWNDIGFGNDAEVDNAATIESDSIVLLSDLLSYSLVDMGAGVGRIQSMLIDLDTGQSPYLLIGFGPTASDDDAYMIPFDAIDVIDISANQMTFNADLTQEDLFTAPQFDRTLFDGIIGEIDASYMERADSFWAEHVLGSE